MTVTTELLTAYLPSHIKRRRATKTEVDARRLALIHIMAEMKPMTVRQVFYQATVCDVVEKSESGYTKVQTDLVQMRRGGLLPHDWLADNTRWQRKPDTFDNIQQALEETARFYRKSLWSEAECYVEIWLEKDALAGVIMPVTYMFDVPLMVDFERVAVLPDQIQAWNLPTRPTKKSDTRSKGFGEISVELDAIAPEQLRRLAQNVIERHLPTEQFNVLKAAEESERNLIGSLVAEALR
jgi:hypothetical protein